MLNGMQNPTEKNLMNFFLQQNNTKTFHVVKKCTNSAVFIWESRFFQKQNANAN